MFSRSLNDLTPEARSLVGNFAALANEAGFDYLIYCTLRPPEEQARLFRKGRSLAAIQARADELDHKFSRPDLSEILMAAAPQSGRVIVTWAGPGQSNHQYSAALDGAPMDAGKPVWSPTDIEATPDVDEGALWAQYGDIAGKAGLNWAGNWSKGKREFPHCEVPGFSWRDMI